MSSEEQKTPIGGDQESTHCSNPVLHRRQAAGPPLYLSETSIEEHA